MKFRTLGLLLVFALMSAAAAVPAVACDLACCPNCDPQMLCGPDGAPPADLSAPVTHECDAMTNDRPVDMHSGVFESDGLALSAGVSPLFLQFHTLLI